MMKRALILLLLTFAPMSVQAQQTSGQRRAELSARRDSLEAEVVRKFVHHLARDLGLNDSQRSETERVLRESGLQRHELSRASAYLRVRIHRATRDSATVDAEFVRLLAEYETLRDREHALWRRDQEALARVLDPRQRAQFLISWARFQDDMREIISRRMREQDDSRNNRSDRGSDRDRRQDGRTLEGDRSRGAVAPDTTAADSRSSDTTASAAPSNAPAPDAPASGPQTTAH